MVVGGKKIFDIAYYMKDFSFHFILKLQVLAKQQMDLLTAKAWLSENKQLEQKVTYYALVSA
jgi:hypothetical protein